LDITSDLKKAKRGAIAKAISIFENDEKESRKLIKFSKWHRILINGGKVLEKTLKKTLKQIPECTVISTT